MNKQKRNQKYIVIFFNHTLTSYDILYGVMSGLIYSTDQSAMSLLFKTEYTRAVVKNNRNIYVLQTIW
jgi:hypothetical protein